MCSPPRRSRPPRPLHKPRRRASSRAACSSPDDRSGLARFAVVANAIVVVVRGTPVTCAGGAPTTTNTNAVLLVDDSDYASASTPNDGNSTVEISDPQTFAPGATPEPTGKSEIEFLLDMREGVDQLSVYAATAPATLVFGDDGANGNGDDDRDLTTIGLEHVRLYGGPDDDHISAGGGAGTGAPLTRGSVLEIWAGAGNDRVRGSDRPALEMSTAKTATTSSTVVAGSTGWATSDRSSR